jgi:hypothetical protein
VIAKIYNTIMNKLAFFQSRSQCARSISWMLGGRSSIVGRLPFKRHCFRRTIFIDALGVDCSGNWRMIFDIIKWLSGVEHGLRIDQSRFVTGNIVVRKNRFLNRYYIRMLDNRTRMSRNRDCIRGRTSVCAATLTAAAASAFFFAR